ncbi:MAG TPA: hypothetical protein DHV62_05160 [Elusimicrobia bacterium]|jgi:iron complex outermembrane receptor protein|nr:hypothetical protein [Elusimicrobiota bacterium]
MKKLFVWLLAICHLLLVNSLFAGTEAYLILTASRLPSKFSDLTRQVTVITAEEISKMPINSVQEVLNYVSGADLQTRSPFGLQSELSLRGANFEQALILINGVRVDDPQTGHHDLTLPLTLKDIERIEILHGGGSSVYGADAFGGVVNFIIKKPKEKNLNFDFAYRDYQTKEGLFSGTFGRENFSQRISVEKKVSSGWFKKEGKKVTDFDFLIFSGLSQYDLRKNFSSPRFSLVYGYTDKVFGAYDFYSPGKDADSREWMKTKFVSLTVESKQQFFPQTKIYFRENDDRFIYKYSINYGINEHTSQILGIDSFLRVNSNFLFGSEILAESIVSTKLGKQRDSRWSLYAEYRDNYTEKLNLSAGLRMDTYSRYDQVLSPSFALGYSLRPEMKLLLSFGKSYRVPSYTELYYEDPANKGNAELKPEEAFTWEGGLNYQRRNYQSKLTLFQREHKEAIDWGRYSSSEKWQVRNIGRLKFTGLESESEIYLFSLRGKFKYSYLKATSEMPSGYQSKYTLRYPEHLFSLETTFLTIFGLQANLNGIYKKRYQEDGYFLLNSRVSKKFGFTTIYLDGLNLLNIKYEEILGVPQPGRWLGIGINWSYN